MIWLNKDWFHPLKGPLLLQLYLQCNSSSFQLFWPSIFHFQWLLILCFCVCVMLQCLQGITKLVLGCNVINYYHVITWYIKNIILWQGWMMGAFAAVYKWIITIMMIYVHLCCFSRISLYILQWCQAFKTHTDIIC